LLALKKGVLNVWPNVGKRRAGKVHGSARLRTARTLRRGRKNRTGIALVGGHGSSMGGGPWELGAKFCWCGRVMIREQGACQITKVALTWTEKVSTLTKTSC